MTVAGAAAIPAVDEVLATRALSPDDGRWLRQWRRDCLAYHRDQMTRWRSWTRRDLALDAYLDAHPYPPHTLQEAPL